MPIPAEGRHVDAIQVHELARDGLARGRVPHARGPVGARRRNDTAIGAEHRAVDGVRVSQRRGTGLPGCRVPNACGSAGARDDPAIVGAETRVGDRTVVLQLQVQLTRDGVAHAGRTSRRCSGLGDPSDRRDEPSAVMTERGSVRRTLVEPSAAHLLPAIHVPHLDLAVAGHPQAAGDEKAAATAIELDVNDGTLRAEEWCERFTPTQ